MILLGNFRSQQSISKEIVSDIKKYLTPTCYYSLEEALKAAKDKAIKENRPIIITKGEELIGIVENY